MESRKTARAEKPQGKVQRVWDDRGAVYELGEKLAEGGQGHVVTTRADARLLVKVSKWPNAHPESLEWQRQIERVHGDGRIEEVWVVPDGHIERSGLETDMTARELDMDDDEPAMTSMPLCPRCGAGVVSTVLGPLQAIVACGGCKLLLSRNRATGLLQVATPDEVDAAADEDPA